MNFFLDFFWLSGLLLAELGIVSPLVWMLVIFDGFGCAMGVDGADGVETVKVGFDESQQSVIRIRGTVISSGNRHGLRKCD